MTDHVTDGLIGRDSLDVMTEANNAGAAVIGEQRDIEVPRDNIYTIVHGTSGDLAIEALGDMIVVVEDKYKTGYECKACDGSGITGKSCHWCNGTGAEPGTDDAPAYCRICGRTPNKGKESCPDCKGMGGLIVAPEVAQKRPTTGQITSIGPDVKHLRAGDRVLFSLFAGSAIDFKQKAVVRLMHEHEAYCKLYGTAKVGDLVR